MKERLYEATDRFKEALQNERIGKVEKDRGSERNVIKDEMVDLHDKFNYFVCLMLKSKKLPLDDI